MIRQSHHLARAEAAALRIKQKKNKKNIKLSLRVEEAPRCQRALQCDQRASCAFTHARWSLCYTFQPNTESLLSKCLQGLSCRRKLPKLQLHQSVLTAFYKCSIESVVAFHITAWLGLLSNTHHNPLRQIITLSGKITGQEQESLISIYHKRTKRKAQQMASDITYMT